MQGARTMQNGDGAGPATIPSRRAIMQTRFALWPHNARLGETSSLPCGPRCNELAFCGILSPKHLRLTIKNVTASEIVSQTRTSKQTAAASPDPRSALPTSSGGTFGRLMRFAIANIRRRPERFALAVLGIALAIAAVTVVRTISASFAITGASSVTNAIGTHSMWVVPAPGSDLRQLSRRAGLRRATERHQPAEGLDRGGDDRRTVAQPPGPGRRLRHGRGADGKGGPERPARPAARRIGWRQAEPRWPHGDRLGAR